MKVYVGLQKNVKGGAIAEPYFFDAEDTNMSYLDLMAYAKAQFNNSDEVVRCPICKAIMVFDNEQSAIRAVKEGCEPCLGCSK